MTLFLVTAVQACGLALISCEYIGLLLGLILPYTLYSDFTHILPSLTENVNLTI